jgi:serine/threonine-protein kinase
MSAVAAQFGAALSGRYSVEDELGHGGMAVVFLAHDVKHDRQVAIDEKDSERSLALVYRP